MPVINPPQKNRARAADDGKNKNQTPQMLEE
jgi:hypothetical protein